MVLDGSWNWNAYLAAGLDLGMAIMPLVSETGLRMSPMFSVFGWAVSKQGASKVEAVKLAQWLSSYEVQKEFALETYVFSEKFPPWNFSLSQNKSVVLFCSRIQWLTPSNSATHPCAAGKL